jgi:hypothetical protein
MTTRRDFIRNMGAGVAGLSVGVPLMGTNAMNTSAKSYNRIMGANDRIRVAIVGLGAQIRRFYRACLIEEFQCRISILVRCSRKADGESYEIVFKA